MPLRSRPLAIVLIEPSPGLATRLHEGLIGLCPASLDIGVARSLREGMHHLCTRDVNLVLMDLTLPDYKGTDAVRALRLTSPSCALVAMSAAADERLLHDALRAGAHEVLSTASWSPSALLIAMERALVRAEQGGGTVPHGPPTFPQTAKQVLHDLNNALTAINGFADVLTARLSGDAAARGAAEQIKTAGARAAALVKAMLPPSDPSAAVHPSRSDAAAHAA